MRAAAAERALTRAVSEFQGGNGTATARPISPAAAANAARAQHVGPEVPEATRPRLVSFHAPSTCKDSSSGSGAVHPAVCARTPERALPGTAASHPSGSKARGSSGPAGTVRTPEHTGQQQGTRSETNKQVTPPHVASAGAPAAHPPQQGSARREREGSGTATVAAASTAHAAAATPTSHFTVHSHSSSSPPTAFEWQFAGGTTPVATPFSVQQHGSIAHTPQDALTAHAPHTPVQPQQLLHPQLPAGGLDDSDDDDEDPFSMPTFSLPCSNSKGAAAAVVAALHQPRSHFGSTPTASLRGGMRGSSELLLPSLGSVNLMLAATSNPSSPRPASAKGLSPGSAQAKHQQAQQQQLQQQAQQQQQQAQQLEAGLQRLSSLSASATSPAERAQAHQQHVRLMQRRLIHEQRRLALLQAHAPDNGADAAAAAAAAGMGSPVGASRMQRSTTQDERKLGDSGVSLQGAGASRRSVTPPPPSATAASSTPGTEQRGRARVMAMAAALEASRHASQTLPLPQVSSAQPRAASSGRRRGEEGRGGAHALTPGSRTGSGGTHASRTPSSAAKVPTVKTAKPTVARGSTNPSSTHRTTPHTTTFSAAASAAAAGSARKQPHSQPLPQKPRHQHHPLQTKTSLLHLAASPPHTSPHSRKNSATNGTAHAADPASALTAAAASLSTSSSSQHGLPGARTSRAHALNSSNSSTGSGSMPSHGPSARRPSHPGTTYTRITSPLPPRPSSSSRSVPRASPAPTHARMPPALTPTHYDARTPSSNRYLAAASPFATPPSRTSSRKSARTGSAGGSAWATPTQLPRHAGEVPVPAHKDSPTQQHTPSNGGRRSSSGVSTAYLQRLKSDVRARAKEREAADAAAAVMPTPSPVSPCPTMRSARSIDASPLPPDLLHPHLAHTAPFTSPSPSLAPTPRHARHATTNHAHSPYLPTTSNSASSEDANTHRSSHRHRHTSSGAMQACSSSGAAASSPYAKLTDFAFGHGSGFGREEGERSMLGLASSQPHSPAQGGRSEDMMPLKQLSAMRSGRQSRWVKGSERWTQREHTVGEHTQ